MSLVIWLLACPYPASYTDTGDPPVDRNLAADTIPLSIVGTPCDACDGACIEENVQYELRYHTWDPIDYADRPPAGGPHNYCWTDWTVHDEVVLDDNWVHNLEHGGVVLLYNCPDGCPEDVAAMATLATSLGDYVVMTEDPEMDSRFAMTAWFYRLKTDCFDEARAAQFYADHVSQGPEATMSSVPEACY